MFTGKAQKNRGAATTYFDEHLTRNDYYSQDVTMGQQAGQWIGLGSERLGLKQGQVVSREAFLRLCDNRHPSTNEQLTTATLKERRIVFDFQCAPPKSVSILAVTLEDQRIVQAHREASKIAVGEMEVFASARIRKGGVEDRDRVTGNLVPAQLFPGFRSAIGTYFVLVNATFPAEQQWKALKIETTSHDELLTIDQ